MSDLLKIKVDATQIDHLGTLLAAAGPKAPRAIMSATVHTGKKARNAMIRALAPQTGLKKKVLERALKTFGNPGGVSLFVIKSKGGNINLKFFGGKEEGSGAVAHPWNHTSHFPGAFNKGGGGFGKKRSRKRIAKLHGYFIRRKGGARYQTTEAKSGLFIPNEMVSGASRTAFMSVVETDLMPRVVHELLRSIPK